ncbi:hypothetical protein [Microvirus mar26]|uniref:Uncharacterized protein n=2 Tax=unclassified Microviridae TaxID=117574 RepID=A0A8F5MLI4_9VIRU|nr:hypothetical protein [Microvirus mar24]QXN75119.1 hypothetical protein [Microvirus mar26]
MKSPKNVGSSRVQSNLLQQNCYVRDCRMKSDLASTDSLSSYVSLDEVTTDKGLDIVEHTYDYPITPQYVNSFVDSVDYRRDPQGAILNATPRKNLGDIRSLQDIMKMDNSSLRDLYDQLSARFSAAQSSATSDSSVSSNNGVKSE